MLSIGQHCRLLQDITVLFPDTEEAYIDLLAGYTDKLKKAGVGELSVASVQRLLGACPNVRLNVDIFGGWEMPMGAMEAMLGDRIEVMSFIADEVIGSLSQVTELCIRASVSREALRNKQRLQVLHVEKWVNDHPYEFVNTIAESTGCLQHLKLRMTFMPLASVFEKLFSANQNLNTAAIELYISNKDEHQPMDNAVVIDLSNPSDLLKYYADVIRHMESLQRIEFVELSAVVSWFPDNLEQDKDVSDVCVPFRHRPMPNASFCVEHAVFARTSCPGSRFLFLMRTLEVSILRKHLEPSFDNSSRVGLITGIFLNHLYRMSETELRDYPQPERLL